MHKSTGKNPFSCLSPVSGAATLVELLRTRAHEQPDDLCYIFLADGEQQESRLTFRELDQNAQAIATWLSCFASPGSRVLLVYPPGLEFASAFFGSLYAGLIAVPTFPPDAARLDRTLPRLLNIANDSQATLALTTSHLLQMSKHIFKHAPMLETLRWGASESITPNSEFDWDRIALSADSLALLQYTSGSTRTPRGVMLTHSNLLHNASCVITLFEQTPADKYVSWLPIFHDMGFMLGVLQPVYAGVPGVLLSPLAFLQRPLRWLKAISNYKGTISGAPNFAYDLCVRKISAEDREMLDLSSWAVAFNGAEPVRRETLERFADTFAPCGFRREALYPCYGLAEATLIVAGGGKSETWIETTLSAPALEQHRVIAAAPDHPDACHHVSSGRTIPDQELVIVNPQTRTRCLGDEVGEVWIASPSVAQGYWNQPDESEQVFNAYIAGTGEGPFLRTGDLGFVNDGEVYVTGRLKDLIIIRGRNHYPQDIELTAECSHAVLRPGCAAAFSIEQGGEELLVIVQEISKTYSQDLDFDEVFDSITRAVADRHELQAYAIALIKSGTIPKTSSGKIQRRACCAQFLNGRLEVVAQRRIESDQPENRLPHQLFEVAARRQPHAIALLSQGIGLTYQQVNEQADRLAHYLHSLGMGAGSRVGILAANSPGSLIGVLGILKVGAACAPLPLAPSAADFASILTDRLTLILAPSRGLCREVPSSCRIVYMDSIADTPAELKMPGPVALAGEAEAARLYDQSGPGLKPRPISYSHQQLLDYFARLDDQLGYRPSDAHLVELAEFDSTSLLETFWALTRGAKIILQPVMELLDHAARPEEQQAGDAMQFSLFYFSSNEAEFAEDKYQLFIEGAKFADRQGFTAVWAPERHFHAFGGLYPNPSVLCSALAMVTERVRLRAGSVVLPLHNPIRVTEEWAVVDNLSNGRVDLAFARGWNPNDFVLSPQSFERNKEILFSEIQNVQKLWRGESIKVPNGIGKETEINVYPLPRQRDLAVWITCSGGIERFIEAGRFGANVLTALLFQSVEELAEKIKAYREARAMNGHDSKAGCVTLMLHTFVEEDANFVWDKVRGPFIEYLKSSVSLWRHGSKNLDDLTETERESLLTYAFERYFRTSALFGTPATCLGTINLLKEIGVNEIACLIDFGIDVPSVLKSLRTLDKLRKLAIGTGDHGNGRTGTEALQRQSLLERDHLSIIHCSPEVATRLCSQLEGEHGSTRLTLMVSGEMESKGSLAAEPPADFRIFTRKERREILEEPAAQIPPGVQNVAGEERRGSAAPGTEIQPQVDEREQAGQTAPVADERRLTDWVRETLTEQVSRSLGVNRSRVPPDKSFHSLGVDSLKAVEIIEALGKQFDISLSPTRLFATPTIAELADHLVQEQAPKLQARMPASNRQTVQPVQAPETRGARESAKVFTRAPIADSSSVRPDDIAVVGMACRFPKAPDLDSFWEMLRAGRAGITEVPADHWDWRAYYDDRPDAENKTYSRWGGFIDGVDQFDPLFFNISPREARLMDPQQRLFLEIAWETFEHAGWSPGKLAKSQTGVFVGCSNNGYYRRIEPALTSLDHSAGIGNQNAVIANRVSFCLDLRGPSVLVDTMCSSSLVAVHLACQSLRQGECTAALAGGVNLLLSPEYYVGMSRMKTHSADGRCMTFDYRANGIALGEGAGAVLLKPLGRAIEDGDTIYAVIKGSAINHGGQTNGLSAPNPLAQAQLIGKALDAAGVTADSITYVEAHGTGTALGDPIEIEGLTRAFRAHSDRKQYCAIGSVKTNIGHLEPAAGISGLIKVILSLQHKLIPPSLNFEKPNPIIPFEETPFRVNKELCEWKSDGLRRAGVSSFGMGGTNVHVIVEEPPALALPESHDDRPLHLLALSAKSESALRALAGRYADFFSAGPQASIQDICFTANAGRSHFEHRLGVIADSPAGMREPLAGFASGLNPTGACSGRLPSKQPPPVVFLFTGQGSQYVGMGRHLYEQCPAFHDAIDRCDAILQPHLSHSLRSVLYGDPETSRLLSEAAYLQPGLFALEYALVQLWRSWGIEPDAVMGHSLGEYVAAYVAGVFTLEDGLYLVAERGRLMQAMTQRGAMLAAFTDEERAASAIAPYEKAVSLAAINGPHHLVLSGEREAMQTVQKQLESEGVLTQRLNVSHAFHSPLMDSILDEFQTRAEGVHIEAPRMPLVSNLTGQVFERGHAPDARYWRQHLRETVRFSSGIQALSSAGYQTFIEIGPTPTLISFAKRCLSNPQATYLPTLRQGQGDWAVLLDSLRALYVQGKDVDWAGGDRHYRRKRLALPTYPFERKRYWIEPHETDEPQKIFTSDTNQAAHAEGRAASMSMVSNLKREPQTLNLLRTMAEADGSIRRDEILSVLRSLVGRFLEMEPSQIDIHQHFLDMGADSLVLIQAIQVVQNTFGIKLSVRQLFEEVTTLDALATDLDQKLSPEVSFRRAGDSEAKAVTSIEESSASKISTAAPSQIPPADAQMALPASNGSHTGNGQTALEQIMSQQLDMVSQIVTRQLEILSRHGALAVPTTPAKAPHPEVLNPMELSNQSSSPLPIQNKRTAGPLSSRHSDGQGDLDDTPKPWAPYQPLNPGRTEELTSGQQLYLKSFIARYTARTKASKRLTQKYRFAHADLRAAMSFRLCTKEMRYPIIGVSSSSSRLRDMDGNEYIDFTMGYGVNLFGHGAPFISEAITEQLGKGIQIGPQTELAGEVAELMCELIGAERVAFCNTGTEAVMAALRLARVATGRRKVALFAGSYHGTSEGVLVNAEITASGLTSVPMVPGIPPSMVEETLVLNYGSPRSLEILKSHMDELAAVLVEPVQSRKPDLQPKEFLHQLRKMTQEAGVALIFDETITGFRIGAGGAQDWFGVKADLATYGKIIGGGMPIGAVAGKADFMNGIDGGMWRFGDLSVPGAKTTLYTGTFCKHPLAMAASLAVLRQIKSRGPELYEELNGRTAALVSKLNAYFHDDEVPIQVANFGSLFRFGGPFQLNSSDGMDLLFYHLIHKGIYVWEGRNWFLSTAHSDAELDAVIQAVKQSVAEMRGGGFIPASPASSRRHPAITVQPADAGQSLPASSGNGSKGGNQAAGAQAEVAFTVPATESQRQLWLMSQMGEDLCAAYNQSIMLRLQGRLHMQALLRAFQTVVDRHEILRTGFSRTGEHQQILASVAMDIPLIDFTEVDEAERDERATQWALAAGSRPFDLSQAPLLRVHLLKLDEENHRLVLTVHHLIADGWSIGVILKEASLLYSAACQGVICKLPEPMQFREYAEWRASQTASANMAGAEDYWLKQLSDTSPSSGLPTDRPRSPIQTYAGARTHITLDGALSAELMELSSRKGATLFMTLLAAFKVLLHKLTAEQDVIVVVPFAGQTSIGQAHLLGDCSNLLALRSHFSLDLTFTEYLAVVKAELLESYDHLDYPFATLIRKADPPRDPSRWPFFNIDRPLAIPRFFNLEMKFVQFPISHTTFDLSFNATQLGDELQFAFDYKKDLFDAETTRHWLDCLMTLLRSVVANPDSRLSDIALPVTLRGPEEATLTGAKRPAKPAPGSAYVAPRNATEEVLAQMWSALLKIERVGVNDNFFERGGHSLMATQLISRIRETFKVELLLRPLFEQPTVAALSKAIEQACSAGQAAPAPPITPRQRDGALPLSFAQMRLWLIDQIEPGTIAYNMPAAVRLKGRLDVRAIERALNEIIKRHEILRATFMLRDERPVQVISPGLSLMLSPVNLTNLLEDEREAEALRLANKVADQPFDLARGPLIRAALFKMGDEDYVLAISIHHLVSDGWSMGVVVAELAALYEAFCSGKPSPLPDLKIQYADYAIWQREWLQGEALAAQLVYWRKQLDGAPPLLQLPTDYPRNSLPSFRGAHEHFVLPPGLHQSLRELSKREGVTLFMTLEAAFHVLLHRHSRATDIIVGTDIANRNRMESEGLIGFFVNLLPLRVNLSGDPTFAELLGRVKEVTLEAYAHQDVPFDVLVHELRPERGLTQTPLVQVLFVLQNIPMPPLRLAGLDLSLMPLESKTAEFELILSIEESEQGLQAALGYSLDLFKRDSAVRMAKQYQTLLEQVAGNPNERISAIRLLTEVETSRREASDFPDAELSLGDFERLVTKINQTAG